jgi:hypothetical protein
VRVSTRFRIRSWTRPETKVSVSDRDTARVKVSVTFRSRAMSRAWLGHR